MHIRAHRRSPDKFVRTAPARAAAEPTIQSRFAAQLLVAQEAERRRVSREMHNDLAQRVALLEFEIEGVKRRLSSNLGDSEKQILHDVVAPELDSLRGAVALLAEDVHRVCEQLHPAVLENLGLVRGIASLCEDYARRNSLTPLFVHGCVPERLPSNVSLCIYRVVQEALQNASKYSGASEVCVSLRKEGRGIRATVVDNGRGFDRSTQTRPGLGLTFIAERVKLLNGRSTIRSAVDKGTRISTWVPYRSSEAGS
jgi:two-component system, NarL family, sensor kinase